MAVPDDRVKLAELVALLWMFPRVVGLDCSTDLAIEPGTPQEIPALVVSTHLRTALWRWRLWRPLLFFRLAAQR